MSRFSKYGKKPKIKLNNGMVVQLNESLLGEVFIAQSDGGRKHIKLSFEFENEDIEVVLPIRELIENLENNYWTLIKTSPLSPIRIVKKFTFL